MGGVTIVSHDLTRNAESDVEATYIRSLILATKSILRVADLIDSRSSLSDSAYSVRWAMANAGLGREERHLWYPAPAW